MAAGNVSQLKTTLKNLLLVLRDYDDTEGKTSNDAIEKYATDFANALDTYAKTLNIIITPGDITTGALSNSGGPVTAANNIIPKITDTP